MYRQCKTLLKESGVVGEIVVADNGSTGGMIRLLEIWGRESFGNLDPFETMRIAIPSATAIALGLQVTFAALFMSLAKWQVRTRVSG